MNQLWTNQRYRPALIILVGVSAIYGAYLLREHYRASGPSDEGQSSLRRRNAVRRGNRSGRLGEQAIAALHDRVEENRPYGYLLMHYTEQDLGQQSGRRRERQWPLLPAMLPTAAQLQALGIVSAPFNPGTPRRYAEKMFVDAFLVNQFPPRHIIGPLESDYLQDQLASMGIESFVVQQSIAGFNQDTDYGAEIRQAEESGVPYVRQSDNVTWPDPVDILTGAADTRGTDVDVHSNFDWRDGNSNANRDRDGQNTLNLLYNIAADQARKDGYIHRGVECNGCGTMPVQGIRYRCANCVDYDLCESCEAQEVHHKTHVFYKIRVPAPSLGALGSSRQGLPVWYPGKPASMPRTLPAALQSRLLHDSGFDDTELDALWDQFRCLAATEWRKDPNKIGMAIDRKTFDRCFVSSMSIRPPPPNLIYDRVFAYYDTNQDGLIGFEEFLNGLAGLNDKSREGRLKRIFKGYDIDADSYVDRKDFLRIFRAFYAVNKELNREMLTGMEEDLIEVDARNLIYGSQPISSAFAGGIPQGHPSRSVRGKEENSAGDLVIVDNEGILHDDAHDGSDRNHFIANAVLGRQPPIPGSTFYRSDEMRHSSPLGASHPVNTQRSLRENGTRHEEATLPSQYYDWPPEADIRPEDVAQALGGQVSLPEIMDPVDRTRVLFAHSERLASEWHCDAVQERWRRRKFYTDVEEGGSAPAGYSEADGSHDDDLEADEDVMESVTSASLSRPLSPRSRSSSKVRFEDSVTDTDYETRSNTSSRSIPVGERWGGYDISEVEKHIGKEILYQTVLEAFNELLDQLFKNKEDLAMKAHKSRKLRREHAKDIKDYADWLKKHSKTTAQKVEKRSSETVAVQEPRSTKSRDSQMKPSPDENQSQCRITDAVLAPHRPLHGSLLTPIDLPPLPNTNTNTNTTADSSTDTSTDNSFRDPTLPQFRPDGIQNLSKPPAPLSTSPTSSSSPTQPPPLPPPSLFDTPHIYPPSSPSKTLLQDLLRDEGTEQEARARGGFGRLDYDEFVHGMCGEDKEEDEDDDDDDDDDDKEDEDEDEDEDEILAGDGQVEGRSGYEALMGELQRGNGNGTSAHQRTTRMRRRRRSRRRAGMDEKARKKEGWEGGGGMGKLGFVGSFIEISNF